MPPPVHPGKGKFIVFRKHGGRNCYGNFLRRTFDKVQEVTRRVRIVRLLLPLLRYCSCWETISRAELLCLEDTKRESRAKFHFHGVGRVQVKRDQNHTVRSGTNAIYFSVTTQNGGVSHRRETFYIMLTCARNGPPGISSTRGRMTRSFENTRVIIGESY